MLASYNQRGLALVVCVVDAVPLCLLNAIAHHSSFHQHLNKLRVSTRWWWGGESGRRCSGVNCPAESLDQPGLHAVIHRFDCILEGLSPDA